MKGKRTVIFNTLVVVMAITGGLLAAAPELEAIIPASVWPIALGVVSAVNLVLRALTTTPIWENGE